MSRPVCGHCGKPYGQRAVEHQTVRWDTPIKPAPQIVARGPQGQPYVPNVLDGEPLPPPPYRGNGVVVKETSPHLSGSDSRMVMTRYVWDGESYWGGYDPFCTLRCALDYARKAFAREHSRDNMRRAAGRGV